MLTPHLGSGTRQTREALTRAAVNKVLAFERRPALAVLSVSWTRDRIVFDPEAGPVRRNVRHVDRRSRRTRSLRRLVAALDEDRTSGKARAIGDRAAVGVCQRYGT